MTGIGIVFSASVLHDSLAPASDLLYSLHGRHHPFARLKFSSCALKRTPPFPFARLSIAKRLVVVPQPRLCALRRARGVPPVRPPCRPLVPAGTGLATRRLGGGRAPTAPAIPYDRGHPCSRHRDVAREERGQRGAARTLERLRRRPRMDDGQRGGPRRGVRVAAAYTHSPPPTPPSQPSSPPAGRAPPSVLYAMRLGRGGPPARPRRPRSPRGCLLSLRTGEGKLDHRVRGVCRAGGGPAAAWRGWQAGGGVRAEPRPAA